MIDLLMSADLLVDTPSAVDRTVELLVDRIGLPEQRATWGHDATDSNYRAMFARVHPRLAVAPTTIEVVAPRDVGVEGDPIVDAWRAQQHRPVRTHATVFATRVFDDVVEHVRQAGVRHRLFAPDEHLPFGRLWLGVADDGRGYQADTDGGLRIEVIPYGALRIPQATPDDARPEGSVERVVARTFLVDDVAASLDRIRAVLGWDGGAEVVDGPHGPTATLRPSEPASAALELVRPSRTGPTLDFYDRHGAGPYGIRLGVHGLDAALRALDGRGTRYTRDAGVATVDPGELDGAVVELVTIS
jgi:hypothetical protein